MSGKSDEGISFGMIVCGSVAVAVVWTVVAGTLWQWVPIAGALSAAYATGKVVDRAFNPANNKGRKRG